jgi:hypothetical protein
VHTTQRKRQLASNPPGAGTEQRNRHDQPSQRDSPRCKSPRLAFAVDAILPWRPMIMRGVLHTHTVRWPRRIAGDLVRIPAAYIGLTPDTGT